MQKQEAILEQELVLIYIENKPAFYARIEKIWPDVKPGWWRVKFLALTFPVKIMTWIIDDEQIRGAEFTMGGIPIRIEKVAVPEEVEEHQPEKQKKVTTRKQARVLSFNQKQHKE